MKFKEAFDHMVHNGDNVKRKSWGGYWHWADGTIWITTREGETIDIRATNDVSYTIRNMLEDDWEIKSDVSNDLTKLIDSRIEGLSKPSCFKSRQGLPYTCTGDKSISKTCKECFWIECKTSCYSPISEADLNCIGGQKPQEFAENECDQCYYYLVDVNK